MLGRVNGKPHMGVNNPNPSFHPTGKYAKPVTVNLWSPTLMTA